MELVPRFTDRGLVAGNDRELGDWLTNDCCRVCAMQAHTSIYLSLALVAAHHNASRPDVALFVSGLAFALGPLIRAFFGTVQPRG